MKTILVPVDFSDVTAKVAAAAGRLAQAFKSRVILFHCVQPEPAFVGFEVGPDVVRQAVARDFKEEHQKLVTLGESMQNVEFEVTALQFQGPTVDKILEEAARVHADLIVMGSHGHGALYNLIVGSVTGGVLKKAPCPVLVVPSRSMQP